MNFASVDRCGVKEKLTEQTVAGEEVVEKFHATWYIFRRWMNRLESACLLLDGSLEVDHG